MADNRRRNPKQKEEESLWKQALTRDSEWKKVQGLLNSHFSQIVSRRILRM